MIHAPKQWFGWASAIVMLGGSVFAIRMIMAYRGAWFEGGLGYPFVWHWWRDFASNDDPFFGYRWTVLAADIVVWVVAIVCLGFATERVVRWFSAHVFHRRDSDRAA